MKIIIFIFCIMLLITGCSNTEKSNKVEYTFNKTLYKVYHPFKANIDNNYTAGKVFNRYDLKEVEKGLMRISTKYFAPIKCFYQDGQYLTKKDLNYLLSSSQLNNAPEVTTYQPRFISYIHEQNYLNKLGDLKGISLGIVLNPYQTYISSDGKINQLVISEDQLVKFAKSKINQLKSYIRKKKALANVDLVIGLYIQKDMSAIVPGAYKYETFIHGNAVDSFNKVDEQYYLITDDIIKTKDLKTYNGFLDLQQKLRNENISLSMMGRGLYLNNKLSELTIDVTTNYNSIGEVINLSQIIAEKLPGVFNDDIFLELIIRNDSKIESIITKDNNQSKYKIFFID